MQRERLIEAANYIIGNVHKHTFAESIVSESYLRLSEEVLSGVQLCQSQCEYYELCGGGSPANKLTENGTMNSSFTTHCQLTVQELAEVVMTKLENSVTLNAQLMDNI